MHRYPDAGINVRMKDKRECGNAESEGEASCPWISKEGAQFATFPAQPDARNASLCTCQGNPEKATGNWRFWPLGGLGVYGPPPPQDFTVLIMFFSFNILFVGISNIRLLDDSMNPAAFIGTRACFASPRTQAGGLGQLTQIGVLCHMVTSIVHSDADFGRVARIKANSMHLRDYVGAT